MRRFLSRQIYTGALRGELLEDWTLSCARFNRPKGEQRLAQAFRPGNPEHNKIALKRRPNRVGGIPVQDRFFEIENGKALVGASRKFFPPRHERLGIRETFYGSARENLIGYSHAYSHAFS